MAKRRPPESKPPLQWNIYVAGKKLRWIGTVEATDADAAVAQRAY
jgi:hypothetical protein